ncbi:adenylate/guanylate cyclase domain-containing protein [Ruegeria lacuscaerulensis]|uniref:adenylate/guanylate cyclase domain-containing protein n=1 Tax=Ruegeria lacuscaerulensis TaxID=55218 RepID=UPI001BE425CC|nr:adenylate/guanylate cyclase domain-containing protein [Ruegeria lacuscaerulensis]
MRPEPDNETQRAKAAWLANLRQSLISPVSAIVGFNELLQSEVDRQALSDVASDLDRISKATADLNTQVDQLLHPETALKLTVGGDESVQRLRHDLRTPMNAIKGYSEMLLEDLDDLDASHLQGDLVGLLDHTDALLQQIDHLAALSDDPAGNSADIPNAPQDTAAMFANLADSMRSIDPIAETELLTGNILVVDDVEANRALLARRLQRDGHQVWTADGGFSALQMASMQPFDLVLLDLMMPDINGFDVLARLKEDDALHDIPVIMISALDEIESVARCIEAGAEDYLPKPFNPVLLQARINAALEKKRWRVRERHYLDQMEAEKQKYKDLLHSILPQKIVTRLNQGEATIADRHSDVTVLFSDIVGFTEMSAKLPPAHVVSYLNRIFSGFDRTATELGVEKIKTIGDAYMVAAGVPDHRDDHAEVIVEMAHRMLAQVEALNREVDHPMHIRIGIHSGPVVAGIIGSHRFLYDIWGDTVNVASRLESTGAPGRVQVSEDTAWRIAHRFQVSDPIETRIKGKGQVRTHFVTGRKPPAK